MEGRVLVEVKELARRGVEALERLAGANEELIQLAKAERDVGEQIENQPGPPFCPHCSRINPRVVAQSEGSGLLSDFVLVMQCEHCGHTFYGMVDSWAIVPDIDAAKELREHRRAGDNDNDS